MNLLFVTPFYPPQTGGVASFLDDARRFLSLRGHQVSVLTTGASRQIEPRPRSQDVYEFYLRTLWVPEAPVRGAVAFVVFFLPTLFKLRQFVRSKQIQLISVEYPLGFGVYFLFLKRLIGVKVTVGLHGDDVLSLHALPAPERRIVKRMIHQADLALAHSESLLIQAKRIVGSLGEHHSYLPYGVDCERLRRLADRPTPAARSFTGPYILTVAKLYERKGIDVLLRAVVDVRDALDGTRFLIVGDGPEEARLKQLASDLEVLEHVVFAGEISNDDIPALMRDCRFFVLPSRSEPFGIVLLEAMTFGKAVLATRVGGIPEFVTTGVTGALVPPEDPQALGEQLRQFLADHRYPERLGQSGLAMVNTLYDYPVVIKRYEALYSAVLQGNLALGAA